MEEQQNAPEQPTTAEILAEAERRRAETRYLGNQRLNRIIAFLDRFVSAFSKHWLGMLNTLAFLYVALPFLAAGLMAVGATAPAAVIQVIYKPLCHQMPQRSWFLFGSQPAYTLDELATLEGMTSIVPEDWQEELTLHPGKEQPIMPIYVALAVDTAVGLGSETLGYKVVLCQRDVAIYGTICLAGVVYALLRKRRKIRPIPWWLYVGLGVIPMLLDGGLQWLAFNLLPLLYWQEPSLANQLFIPPYETTPLMRTLTGALFGLMTVWLAYPHVQGATEELETQVRGRAPDN